MVLLVQLGLLARQELAAQLVPLARLDLQVLPDRPELAALPDLPARLDLQVRSARKVMWVRLGLLV